MRRCLDSVCVGTFPSTFVHNTTDITATKAERALHLVTSDHLVIRPNLLLEKRNFFWEGGVEMGQG